MKTNDIRQKYLEFFRGKKHVVVPSSPLVPENDPSTLFTGSGMQPMVPYLLGAKHPSGTRVTNSQKCFRSQDIEEVGDNRHTTFFEMLGNWSFGDYFKTEQVEWMWEFLATELKLDPNRLYFSCFRGNKTINVPRDTESALRWQALFESVGIEAKIGEDPEKDGMQPGERIFYYAENKNWWSRAGMPDNMPIGEPGGGDTEMFWDFDPTNEKKMHEQSVWKDEPCHVNCDCGRFMEIGNNVFMEYKKTETGFERLVSPNVDFGGGLERMAAALADDSDVFKLDLFTEARTTLETLSRKSYGESAETTHAFRVILDHIRAAVFLIGDGVLPSNKDQGYFVRRLIRRAVRYGKKLGIKAEFISSIAITFIAVYQSSYPNLSQKREYILSTLDEEEKKFQNALIAGLDEFKKITESVSRIQEDIDRATSRIDFSLIQKAAELHKNQEMLVNNESFIKAVERTNDSIQMATEHIIKLQEDIDRATSRIDFSLIQKAAESAIISLQVFDDVRVREGYENIVKSINTDSVRLAAEKVEKIQKDIQEKFKNITLFPKTTFDLYQTYGFPLEMIEEEAKKSGLTVDKNGFLEELKKHQDLSRTASAGKFKGGLADNSAKVTALHTSTHLMLAALRKELGNDIHQAGSNITEERTRFDFTYPEKVPREVLDRVEAYVNTAIEAGATITTKVMEKEAAKAAGVEGSFWEKYPEKVTVYQVEGPDGTIYSAELCGGPHVAKTADITAFGRFRITKEEASSAGVRRVKAVLE